MSTDTGVIRAAAGLYRRPKVSEIHSYDALTLLDCKDRARDSHRFEGMFARGYRPQVKDTGCTNN